jgi:hypothetical protein
METLEGVDPASEAKRILDNASVSIVDRVLLLSTLQTFLICDSSMVTFTIPDDQRVAWCAAFSRISEYCEWTGLQKVADEEDPQSIIDPDGPSATVNDESDSVDMTGPEEDIEISVHAPDFPLDSTSSSDLDEPRQLSPRSIQKRRFCQTIDYLPENKSRLSGENEIPLVESPEPTDMPYESRIASHKQEKDLIHDVQLTPTKQSKQLDSFTRENEEEFHSPRRIPKAPGKESRGTRNPLRVLSIPERN